LLDDPLHHNDIIHAAAFVDLMRNLVERKGHQLLMSSHERNEAEFISRKFDPAGIPCSVLELTAPSRTGVNYMPIRYNEAAKAIMQSS
jgi:ABC-type nitrate/sulfonate/bicarbonate transport system ATPase subunit